MTQHLELPPLPHGWCWTTLEEVAAVEGGITKDSNRPRSGRTREVPYLRVANVQRGYLDLSEVKTILAEEEDIHHLRLRPGDILFTEGGDRDKLGRGWVWNGEIEECIHQNHVFRARPDLAVVEPRFVSLHGNHFGQEWFSRTGKQTTNLASINKGVLLRFPVPLAPRDEQRRIVAKVDELFSDLDAGVSALERAQAKLKSYRAAVLRAAVTGELTAEWRAAHPDVEPARAQLNRTLEQRRHEWERGQQAKFATAGKKAPKNWQAKYVEPANLEVVGMRELPPGWCWATVNQVAEPGEQPVLTGPFGLMLGREDFIAQGVPVLTIGCLTDSGVSLDKAVFISESKAEELSRYRVREGDLLFSRSASVGRVGLVTAALAGCVVNYHIMRLRLAPSVLLPTYFVSYVRGASEVKTYLREVNHGATRDGINTESLLSMPVAVPPAKEQIAIVREIDQRMTCLAAVVDYIEAVLQRSGRLRQSVLKEAFAGRLVSQDPNDEPASALLERIKQARSPVGPLSSNGKARSRTSRQPNLFE